MKLRDLGERRCLEIIRRYTQTHPCLEIGFGDDAAVLRMKKKGERMAVSTDLLVEGIHFLLPNTGFNDLGVKSYHVNASDMAAMGAWPVATFISLGLPPETDVQAIRDFYRGFAGAARRHGCVIAGGDMVRSDRMIVCVTIVGRYQADSRPLVRSGARFGHRVYVTGWPGESGMGLKMLLENPRALREKRFLPLIRRHLIPQARVKEGAALAESRSTGAVIDVSDGIYNELTHLAIQGRIRLKIEASRLPLSPLLKEACLRKGESPLDMLLFGGEDYELLFTSSLPPAKIQNLFRVHGSRIPVHEIGSVEKGRGVTIVDERDKPIKIVDQTFQHFTFEKR